MGGRRHKGTLSNSAIDRGWPHQVALPEHAYLGHRYRTLHYFVMSERLTLAPIGHSFRRDDTWYSVFCFAEREHAERFREKFGGEWIDPSKRPRLEEGEGASSGRLTGARASIGAISRRSGVQPRGKVKCHSLKHFLERSS